MKLIDLLYKISKDEVEPPLYFRINTFGYNFVIKYLYFEFIIVEVKSSFTDCMFKKRRLFS